MTGHCNSVRPYFHGISSLYGAPERGWPSSDSSWQSYYTLYAWNHYYKLSIPFQVLKEIFFLGIGLTVT